VCFDFIYNFCLKHFSFWDKLREIWSKKYVWLHIKYPFFMSDFNETWICSTDFRKIRKYQISWKSTQWELSCSMWTDRQTVLKPLVSFCSFTNAPKNYEVETNHPFTTSHTSDSCLADELFSDISDTEIKGSSITYVWHYRRKLENLIWPIL